jgi:DNA-binding beta-propeller fold protein YncE
MNSIRLMALNIASAAVLLWAFTGAAAGQNVIASISIPATSAGQVAVNTALNKIYAGGGPNSGGTSLTAIDGVTFVIVTTVTPSAGVAVDMKSDKYWAGNLTAGDVVVYEGDDNVELSSTSVGSCPAAVTFDCKGRIWVASQCGKGNDPLWVFAAGNLKLLDGPIPSGGTILQPPVVNPDTEKVYVTAGGVSEEINPATYAVSNTTFGTVMAIDSATNRLFATSGNHLQIVAGHDDAIFKTITLTYTPAARGVNNALQHVYLLNPAGNSIDVYSETGNKVTTFLLGTNNQPKSLAVDSVRGRLLVDVLNTGTNTWSLDVIEDLSSARKCGYAGSCDY